MKYNLYFQDKKSKEWLFSLQTEDLNSIMLNDLIKTNLRLGFNIKVEVV